MPANGCALEDNGPRARSRRICKGAYIAREPGEILKPDCGQIIIFNLNAKMMGALLDRKTHTHTEPWKTHLHTHPYTAARAAVTPVIVLAARIIYPREMHAVRAFIIYKHTPQPGHPNTHTHTLLCIYSIIGIDCDTVIYCICRGLMVVHFCIYVCTLYTRVCSSL